jgi:hypothetical protein
MVYKQGLLKNIHLIYYKNFASFFIEIGCKILW